ncbi:MAG: hypothetical protein EON60_00270 [Alphaproteobacteria bacterium]|nr:MAG: hypothetical protein EON60_00270 [Alphaproteobacteria bacterium]
MSIFALLGGTAGRPTMEQRANRIADAILWRALLVIAVFFLGIACWRVLESAIGPILAPLAMAAGLSVVAGVLAFIDARRKRRIKSAPPAIAPLVATLLEIAFAPKLVRWFTIGSLMYDLVAGGSPLNGTQSRRQVKPRF